MSKPGQFISIRWKVILLTSLVLAMTGSFFIWQQYKLQLADFDEEQVRFHDNMEQVVQQLLIFQAERIEALGRILVEHDNVRQYILQRDSKHLLEAVEVLSSELTSGQSINGVVFHDENQRVLATWGNSPSQDIVAIAHRAILREMPQDHVSCQRSCEYQMILPIVWQGRTIGTISLISSLEDVVLNLYHLSNAQIAVLNGYSSKSSNPFTPFTNVLSMNGGSSTARMIEAARVGKWQTGHFQAAVGEQVYRMVGIPIAIDADNQPWLAVISDVTDQVQTIRMLVKRSLLWGAAALISGILLLYLLLQPTMRRIQHVGRVLPLLGEEKFAEVRAEIQPRHRWTDETDALENLAKVLATQLENLKHESVRYAASLSTQAMQLAQERDFIAGLLDTAPVLIVSYDQNGAIHLANQYALEACGFTFSTLTGQKFQQVFLQNEAPDCFDNLLLNTHKQRNCRNESTLRNADGEIRSIVWFHSRLTQGNDADNYTLLSIGMDISTQKQQAAEIHTLAYYDPLTHLPNRRLLMDRLHHLIALEESHQNYCALIAIDLDGFKLINDTKGHNVGNWILTEIAKRLQHALDDVNTIVRVGSDEFVVLLEELGRDATQAAVQTKLTTEMLRDLMSAPYYWQGQEIHCTSSFGIDVFMGGTTAAEEHIKQAEIALHYAKSDGRNTLRFFDPDMQTMLERRSNLEADLRLSLPRNQFHLFYQPQVNVDGQIIGAECLLRWIHPERGLVSPLQFIALAEETQLILPIGQWVLETACQQIKAWENDARTADLHLAVNVSAQQFHQPDFVEQVQTVLKKFAIDPSRLKIELTESTILDNIVETIDKMEALRLHGVRFSMDDFGTGYSSLAYLTQLPLAQLKVDQAFVRNLGIKHSDAVIVQTIINMAKSLDMDVLAEGVETLEQQHFLQQAGCYKFQGYLFGRPLPIGEFMECITHGGKDCPEVKS